MSDTYNLGPVSGSSFAVGRNSVNHGVVVNGPRDVAGLRAELDVLRQALAARPATPEVTDALRRADQLEEVVIEEAPPEVVQHSWSKLSAALNTLQVTANLAQIASFVVPFLT
jgi:hypothetical protein